QEASGKNWTPDVVLGCLANLFIFFRLEMTLPTIPRFVKALSRSDPPIGGIIGIYNSSEVLFRPYIGKALETIESQLELMVGLRPTGTPRRSVGLLRYIWKLGTRIRTCARFNFSRYHIIYQPVSYQCGAWLCSFLIINDYPL